MYITNILLEGKSLKEGEGNYTHNMKKCTFQRKCIQSMDLVAANTLQITISFVETIIMHAFQYCEHRFNMQVDKFKDYISF